MMCLRRNGRKRCATVLATLTAVIDGSGPGQRRGVYPHGRRRNELKYLRAATGAVGPQGVKIANIDPSATTTPPRQLTYTTINATIDTTIDPRDSDLAGKRPCGTTTFRDVNARNTEWCLEQRRAPLIRLNHRICG